MKKILLITCAAMLSLAGMTQEIRLNQPIAIYVKDGGYLTYEERSWGINLGWSSFPSFEWELRNGGASGAVQNGVPVELYNRRIGSCVIYGSRDYGINLVWGSTQPVERRCDWFIEGNLSDGSPNVYFKNKYQTQHNAGDPYIKYGSRTWGINMVWAAKPSAPNIELIVNKVNPGELVSEKGTWSFSNFKTQTLSWNSFSKAFDLGWRDEDSWNPLTPVIFYAARGKLAAGGNCFGMCLGAEFIAERNGADLPYVGRVEEPLLYNYGLTDQMKKAMNVFHWKQLSTRFIDGWVDGLMRDCRGNLDRIKNDLAINKFGLLSIYNSFPGTSGHLLIPYRVEKIPNTNADYKVFVYDPNRPATTAQNINTNVLIVRGNSFSYNMGNSGTWSAKMSYVSYEKASYYDDLLNGLFEVGYIILGADTQIDQISDGAGKKLFTKDGNGRNIGIDFSGEGLGSSIVPFIPLGDSGQPNNFFYLPSDTSFPGTIADAIIEEKKAVFGENPVVYLIRNNNLQDLQISIKQNVQNKKPVIEVGNKKEYVQFEVIPAVASLTKTDITLKSLKNITTGFSAKPAENKSVAVKFRFGRKAGNTLERTDVTIPQTTDTMEVIIPDNEEIKLKVNSLKEQEIRVNKTIIRPGGSKTSQELNLKFQ